MNIFSLYTKQNFDTNKQTDNCKVNIDLAIAEAEFKEFESPLNFGRFKCGSNSLNSDISKIKTFCNSEHPKTFPGVMKRSHTTFGPDQLGFKQTSRHSNIYVHRYIFCVNVI